MFVGNRSRKKRKAEVDDDAHAHMEATADITAHVSPRFVLTNIQMAAANELHIRVGD